MKPKFALLCLTFALSLAVPTSVRAEVCRVPKGEVVVLAKSILLEEAQQMMMGMRELIAPANSCKEVRIAFVPTAEGAPLPSLPNDRECEDDAPGQNHFPGRPTCITVPIYSKAAEVVGKPLPAAYWSLGNLVVLTPNANAHPDGSITAFALADVFMGGQPPGGKVANSGGPALQFVVEMKDVGGKSAPVVTHILSAQEFSQFALAMQRKQTPRLDATKAAELAPTQAKPADVAHAAMP